MIFLNERSEKTNKKQHYIMIDFIRGFAVLLMIIFHLTFDLNLFRILHIPFLNNPYWLGFGRFVLILFLICVGMGLAIVHKQQIKWRLVNKRLYKIGGWALIITIVTYMIIPKHFVFFGILHLIAVASLAGVFFVKRPRLSLLLCLMFVIPDLIFGPTLIPAAKWLKVIPADYIPFYPWFGIVLLGIYLESVNFHKIPLKRNYLTRPFEAMGKHSLKIYLLHQPILIGMLLFFNKLKQSL
jgi:uncharacterized membrane protein